MPIASAPSSIAWCASWVRSSPRSSMTVRIPASAAASARPYRSALPSPLQRLMISVGDSTPALLRTYGTARATSARTWRRQNTPATASPTTNPASHPATKSAKQPHGRPCPAGLPRLDCRNDTTCIPASSPSVTLTRSTSTIKSIPPSLQGARAPRHTIADATPGQGFPTRQRLLRRRTHSSNTVVEQPHLGALETLLHEETLPTPGTNGRGPAASPARSTYHHEPSSTSRPSPTSAKTVLRWCTLHQRADLPPVHPRRTCARSQVSNPTTTSPTSSADRQTPHDSHDSDSSITP